jgi:molybdate transport system substrate-binding protein
MNRVTACLALSLTLLVSPARADEVQIAVAANFIVPAKQIAAEFEKASGHKALLSFGATGKFYAQIKNGAPFEVLLAADDETPERLAREGAALADSRFTYAIGTLVLWSPRPDGVDAAGNVLRQGNFTHIALANPKLAPYGVAAEETMKALGVYANLQAKFVTAENLAQAHQFIASGNAQLGFIALAQIQKEGRIEGSAWIVPANLHTPIRQDAVILEKGRGKPAAQAWMNFLKSDKVRAFIAAAGYSVPAR